jgi:predicted GTPase
MVKYEEVKMGWFEKMRYLIPYKLKQLRGCCTGAVTVAVVTAGTAYRKFSVIATAQADAAAVLPHGMGALPGFVAADLCIVLIPAETLVAFLSEWTVGVVDATNVNLVKSTAAAGSASANVQLFVVVMLPHSLIK